MALAGGGVFRTIAPTRHARTNADVIRQFTGVPIAFEEEAGEGNGVYRVSIGTYVNGRMS